MKKVAGTLIFLFVLSTIHYPLSTFQTPVFAEERPWEKEVPREKIPFSSPHEITQKKQRWENVLIIDVSQPSKWIEEHIPGNGT